MAAAEGAMAKRPGGHICGRGPRRLASRPPGYNRSAGPAIVEETAIDRHTRYARSGLGAAGSPTRRDDGASGEPSRRTLPARRAGLALPRPGGRRRRPAGDADDGLPADRALGLRPWLAALPPLALHPSPPRPVIGRASRRGRVCQYW